MFKAIGVIELKSIPKGVEAADAALKSAGIEMVSAHPSCPGKYEMVLAGSISNVSVAVEHVCKRFDGYVVDSAVMGKIDEQVIKALFGTQEGERKGSLGIIETFSKAYLSTQFSDAIVFLVLIVILLVKPAGLLGKQIQEKV